MGARHGVCTHVRSMHLALSREGPTKASHPRSCEPAHVQGKEPGFSEYSQFQSWDGGHNAGLDHVSWVLQKHGGNLLAAVEG